MKVRRLDTVHSTLLERFPNGTSQIELIVGLETIMTCFPGRAGNDSDSSNVHKRICQVIRNKLTHHRLHVWEVATIVIDECSRVLFEPFHSNDGRPDVQDIFAHKINSLVSDFTS